MFCIYAYLNQRQWARAVEQLQRIRALEGRKWKCGPWRWTT